MGSIPRQPAETLVSSLDPAEAPIYGYLNRVRVEFGALSTRLGATWRLMWLLGRLVPDHKTIADFRKDNGAAIRKVCAHFIALSRAMEPADASQRRN